MDKRIIKISFVILMTVFTLLILQTISNAAAVSISTSKSSVAPGESFTVTVSLSGGAGPINTVVSNGTGSHNEFLDNNSYQFACTAGSSGSVTITASGRVGNYATETLVDVSDSKTVTIAIPQQEQPTTPATPTTPSASKPSSNANLSNLGINPYDFKGFKASKTSYSVTVPKDVSSISIYAYTQDSKATVSGTGKKNLEIGNNTFRITVRAEDGTTKVYLLYITRSSEEVVGVTQSSDCALSALTVAEGEITPTFDPTIKEYTVIVPEEIAEVNITATPNSDTATVTVEGGKELQLGENIATITVVAEDGTTGTYTIKIIKSNMKLGLQKLVIGYINEEGEFVELKISPELSEDVFEYILEDIEYTIENLKIDAIANNEAFKIEIEGNENLKEGKNTIIIKVIKEPTLEGEELEEIEYKITVNKKANPEQAKIGIIGKIQNWFTMIGNFANKNQKKIIVGALSSCSVAMLGLSIYMVMDYKKYKMLLEKIATLTRANSQMTNTTLENKDLKDNDEQ